MRQITLLSAPALHFQPTYWHNQEYTLAMTANRMDADRSALVRVRPHISLLMRTRRTTSDLTRTSAGGCGGRSRSRTDSENHSSAWWGVVGSVVTTCIIHLCNAYSSPIARGLHANGR
jgi:hypothetical protein